MRHGERSRRRGSALVLVLGASTLVTVIGIAGLMMNRVVSRTTQAGQEVSHARVSAHSALDLAVWNLVNNPTWRLDEANDAWSVDMNIAGAVINRKYVDEVDGDLANNNVDPVRVYGKATVGDSVRIYSMVMSPSTVGTVDRGIASGADDAEQHSVTDVVYHDSTDLELVVSPSSDVAAVRFTDVQIPQGAIITHAYVQFTADEVWTGPTSLWIKGGAADDSAPITPTLNNIGSRLATVAWEGWTPAAWSVIGEAGPDQRTPDLSSIITEIVERPGWTSGNAMLLAFLGSGTRTAVAYDWDPSAAAQFHVEWTQDMLLYPVRGTWRREPSD